MRPGIARLSRRWTRLRWAIMWASLISWRTRCAPNGHSQTRTGNASSRFAGNTTRMVFFTATSACANRKGIFITTDAASSLEKSSCQRQRLLTNPLQGMWPRLRFSVNARVSVWGLAPERGPLGARGKYERIPESKRMGKRCGL